MFYKREIGMTRAKNRQSRRIGQKNISITHLQLELLRE
jgi:hypothetical protein